MIVKSLQCWDPCTAPLSHFAWSSGLQGGYFSPPFPCLLGLQLAISAAVCLILQ